jgi:hypothetical protein
MVTFRGETLVLGQGGGGELVLPDQKGVAKVVPDGRVVSPLAAVPTMLPRKTLFLFTTYWGWAPEH